MNDFEYQKCRLQQNLWDIISNNGTTLVAVNYKTGEKYNGTTAGFNAIFNTTPDMNPDDDYVRYKANPLSTEVCVL